MYASLTAGAAPASAWWNALNSGIDGHIAKLAEHEANIDRALADMAARHIEGAAFLDRWNAMSYREATAFMREREAVDA